MRKFKSPLPGITAEYASKGKGSQVLATETQDAQIEDDSQAMSNLDSQVQEMETQLEETQLNGSPPPAKTEAETQPATQTQTEEGTHSDTQVDEDDGGPVSNFAWVGTLLARWALTGGRWGWISIRSSIGWLHHHERQQ